VVAPQIRSLEHVLAQQLFDLVQKFAQLILRSFLLACQILLATQHQCYLEPEHQQFTLFSTVVAQQVAQPQLVPMQLEVSQNILA
jgi:hypothetical protein